MDGARRAGLSKQRDTNILLLAGEEKDRRPILVHLEHNKRTRLTALAMVMLVVVSLLMVACGSSHFAHHQLIPLVNGVTLTTTDGMAEGIEEN